LLLIGTGIDLFRDMEINNQRFSRIKTLIQKSLDKYRKDDPLRLAGTTGAAGSLVIILLWFFYSSIIFFLGAEITQQYAELTHHKIEPKSYAVHFEIDEGQNLKNK
jgi:hypothetical protein